jgi:hypothetical protein
VEKRFLSPLGSHGYNDIRHTGICTAEPQVSDPNAFESEIAVEEKKRHKSADTDQIST